MNIVLVRHGVSRHHDGRLSQHGEHQILSLAKALKRRHVVPTCLLSSRCGHARQSVEILRDFLTDATVPIIELDALTPRRGPSELDQLLSELEAENADLSTNPTVVVVGHEGRLSNLLTELTNTRSRPLGHGEAVVVGATTLMEMLQGHGQIISRHPVLDHQEDVLREKVQSKMTVATFLAGFVFTALSALLLVDGATWPWHRIVSATALTGSLCLLIASVYVFDQLSTPVGFWTDAPRPRLWRRMYERQERAQEERWETTCAEKGAEAADEEVAPWRLDGPIYRIMLDTSRYLYNPAVAMGLVGFLMLLIGTSNNWVVVFGCLALLVSTLYAGWRRPNLGAD